MVPLLLCTYILLWGERWARYGLLFRRCPFPLVTLKFELAWLDFSLRRVSDGRAVDRQVVDVKVARRSAASLQLFTGSLCRPRRRLPGAYGPSRPSPLRAGVPCRRCPAANVVRRSGLARCCPGAVREFTAPACAGGARARG